LAGNSNKQLNKFKFDTLCLVILKIHRNNYLLQTYILNIYLNIIYLEKYSNLIYSLIPKYAYRRADLTLQSPNK